MPKPPQSPNYDMRRRFEIAKFLLIIFVRNPAKITSNSKLRLSEPTT